MSDAHGHLTGIAAPLPIPNLDTDQIMPKQFLRGINKAGLDRGLFYDLRFEIDGTSRADFVLNRSEYADTSILVASENFGCGSSREHAVWGLLQYGIRAVIASSFGEIFYSNALNNGLIAAVVTYEDQEAFLADVSGPTPAQVTVDVLSQTITSPLHLAPFELSHRHREMLLGGLDLIGSTMAKAESIGSFAERHFDRYPWIRNLGQEADLRSVEASSARGTAAISPDASPR